MTLTDGQKVIAADDYLEQSIRSAGAAIVAGYTVQMTQPPLSNSAVAAIID